MTILREFIPICLALLTINKEATGHYRQVVPLVMLPSNVGTNDYCHFRDGAICHVGTEHAGRQWSLPT